MALGNHDVKNKEGEWGNKSPNPKPGRESTRISKRFGSQSNFHAS